MDRIFRRTLVLFAILFAALYAETAGAQTWFMLGSGAKDIGVGADGSVWVIGGTPTREGYSIYRLNGGVWTNVPGAALRIAVGPDGNAWMVNGNKNIFHYTGTTWALLPGAATDIGVGPDNIPWVIGAGGSIWKWNGTNGWTQMPGGASRITVCKGGVPWVVNSAGNIFRWNGSSWDLMPGTAKDVGAGADGSVWVTGLDGGIYYWNGSNWSKATGGASQIAVGPTGVPWVVNDGGQVYSTVPQIFPRGQGYEAKVLRAMGYGIWAHTIVLGGGALPAPTAPLDQAFARLELGAAEAFFASRTPYVPVSADQAIAQLSGLDPTLHASSLRAAVNGFLVVYLATAVSIPASDPQTQALRSWATNLYRSMRVTYALATVNEYYKWANDPCGYSGLPPMRCSGVASLYSMPLPDQNLLGKNAVGAAFSSNATAGVDANAIAAAVAIASGAVTTAAAAAILTSSVLTGPASAAVGAAMVSLAGAFGVPGGVASAYAASAGLGALGWGSVVAAPVAAAVMIVVVGVTEGLAIVEAAQVLPRFKMALGAAMTQQYVIENELSVSNSIQLFALAFAQSALNGYTIPNASINGEVRFFNQAGFNAQFALNYTLNGTPQSNNTGTLTVGQEKTFAIPAAATGVTASGQWFDGVNWHSLFSQSFPVTYTGFTTYGTLFAPSYKNSYPELNASIGQASSLTLTQGGGYVANFLVTYVQAGQTVTALNVSGQGAGWHQVVPIPATATNIHLLAQTQTGLAWAPTQTIVDTTYPSPPNVCVKVFGTTLAPQYDNQCS
jgi:hypothetical protein